MGVRKVVTRSGRGFRGFFPSKKMNRLVEFESILEMKAIKLFEACSFVKNYSEQPTIITYYRDDGLHHYFPDFELQLVAGAPIHIEIKPSKKILVPNIREKYQAINLSYQERNELFFILTELDLEDLAYPDVFAALGSSKMNNYLGE